MVRPTRAARAHDRSRGGKLYFVLSLTVSHACGIPSSLRYLTRMGASASAADWSSCSQATDDEKNRELVMTVVGQEPGNERSGPCTPLLAPFITYSVLLRVNNMVFRR